MVECNQREGSEGQSLFKRTLLACGQKAFKVFVVWLPRGGKGWQDGPRVMEVALNYCQTWWMVGDMGVPYRKG